MFKNGVVRVLLIFGGILLVTGCGTCPRSKCMAQLVLAVHAGSGSALSPDAVSVESTRTSVPCSKDEACTFRVFSGGDYTVTAAGYESVVVHIDDVRDDCGDPVSQTIDVALVAEGDLSRPPPKVVLGGSCSS